MDGYLDDFADNLSSQTVERLATFGGYFANEALDEIDRLSQSLVVLYDNDTPAALLWVMVSPMAPSVLGFIFTKDGGEDITQFSDEIKQFTSIWLWEHGSLSAYPLASDTQLVALLLDMGFIETSRAKMYSPDGAVRERITMEIG